MMSITNDDNLRICEICCREPGSHSFSYIGQTDAGNPIFYTRVADAIKYDDTDGILTHYQNMLNIKQPKNWIWIFNCDGFGLKHALELKTSRGIARIIAEYGQLKRILVINSNFWINCVMYFVCPLLPDEINESITLIRANEKEKYVFTMDLLGIPTPIKQNLLPD